MRQASEGLLITEKFFIVYYAVSDTFFPNQFSACACCLHLSGTQHS